ncbi:AfsR/SARP family transcriptional regulator [Allokutzneria albata]|uniref:DNA-binding transcriptional activator of the SARP family n=1 Tax=Allokutzneria albata TaxID=211114 RepID=A0A1G9QX58_ALLAB|nr:AfsR/SARP family transcriptional regulator [Allokutzneria albata]SDM15622.1 DNA-binding transcriptional activator of the SARP family [Allokutzneria albata]
MFRALGMLQVDADDGETIRIPARKQRTLLCALVLHANEWTPVARLVETVWPRHQPPSARGNLKTYVHHLRRVLPRRRGGGERLSSRPGDYQLRLDRGELDAWVFEDLLAEGRRALAAGQNALAATLLEDALRLWRGRPFCELATATADAYVARLEEQRWSAREDVLAARLALGQHRECVEGLRQLLTEQPLREHLWCQLLWALYLGGRRADALAAYRTVRELLISELGIEPGEELQRTHQEILLSTPRAEWQGAAHSPIYRATAAIFTPTGAHPAN